MSDKSVDAPTSMGIVRAVFYAIVASTLASALCNHVSVIKRFGELWLKAIKAAPVLCYKPCCELIKFANQLSNYDSIFMGIGIFAFITLYFHDEWKYGEHPLYPKENCSVVCWGWSFFIFQVCFLSIWPCGSAILGIIGTSVISAGFEYKTTEGGKDNRSDSSFEKRFRNENIWWIVAMGIYVAGSILKWIFPTCTIVLLSALFISLIQMLPLGIVVYRLIKPLESRERR